jgi:sterol desaturase/sphingolipid hydroxylase (fatty acid hydroxylase superfamily)
MISFVAGLLVANAGEWFIHKYWLHGRGKRRESFWSFHFHEHHNASRRAAMIDTDYGRSTLGWHAQGKEAAALVLAAAVHLPLLPFAPAYVAGVWTSIGTYYTVHRLAHTRPDWGRRWLPWHYDHHMGRDQDTNWCVTWPGFDWVMGTRVPYKDTHEEEVDRRRAAARAARVA